MEKYVAGVDPGMLGAVSLIDSTGKLVAKWVFLKDSSGKLDLHSLNCLIWSVEETWHPVWWLEEVHSIFGAGKGSMFKLGENLGLLKGMLQGNGCTWNSITPKNWQKIWQEEDIIYKDPNAKRKVKDTKKTSLRCFERLYPGVSLLYGDNEPKQSGRRTKQNEGLIDSLLIARSQLGN